MPKISIDALTSYFSQHQTHSAYKDTVKLYESLRIHADGDFPEELIKEKRPSESEEIFLYRKKTYKPKTKRPISKVLTSLSKIRRSPDYSIGFDSKAVPTAIIPDETLEKYCSEKIPEFGSITNWAFGVLLKQNAIDANAVIAVIPLEQVSEDSYTKPVPIIFNSDRVLEYNEQKKFCILRANIKINIRNEDGSYNYSAGNRFYYIDDLEVIVYDQTNTGYAPVLMIPHNLKDMPAFKVKGEAYKQFESSVVNKSRLDAMVPSLDEAATEYSDLKGSKTLHLFPTMWYVESKDCDNCKGGHIPSTTGGPPKTCDKCGGSGKVKFSPFANLAVSVGPLDSKMPFSAPGGYITKDTAILELQEKSVDKNMYEALSAINMQFLDQTPLNISGEAKSVDREELNNFVYNFAEDLIYAEERAIYYINEWRYNYIVPDTAKRRAMLPKIPVPQNFDLLPSDYLMQEIGQARTSKVNPFLISTLETELAVKKFYNNPEIAETTKLFFYLDPLPGVSAEDKLIMLTNNGITKQDYVISNYMGQFIRRAIIEKPDFSKIGYEDQMNLLKKYADDKINATSDAAQIANDQKQTIIREMSAPAATA